MGLSQVISRLLAVAATSAGRLGEPGMSARPGPTANEPPIADEEFLPGTSVWAEGAAMMVRAADMTA